MSKEFTLKKINEDIAFGDLGKARDRLHSLVHAYPDDLKLRLQLGKIYHELQFPAMAGRYWYLEENKTPEMRSACEAFEKDRGMDPFHILAALQFNGNYKCLNNFAMTKIHALEKESANKYGRVPNFKPSGRRTRSEKPSLIRTVLSGAFAAGCMVLLVAFIVLAIKGFFSLF